MAQNILNILVLFLFMTNFLIPTTGECQISLPMLTYGCEMMNELRYCAPPCYLKNEKCIPIMQASNALSKVFCSETDDACGFVCEKIVHAPPPPP